MRIEDRALGSTSGDLIPGGYFGYSLPVPGSSKENDKTCLVGIVECSNISSTSTKSAVSEC